MNVHDRIEQAPACEVINLTEAEKDLYTGCGWKLARFEDGQLTELFDLADETLDNAVAWIANAEGEVWLAMCSCYQLCEPRRITLTDAPALARLARAMGETSNAR